MQSSTTVHVGAGRRRSRTRRRTAQQGRRRTLECDLRKGHATVGLHDQQHPAKVRLGQLGGQALQVSFEYRTDVGVEHRR